MALDPSEAFPMSFAARFFKKPWQDKNPEIRAKAVATADHPALVEQLPELARNDESAGVRLAALRRLKNDKLWLDARAADTSREVQAAADQRFFKQALEGTGDSALGAEGEQWLERYAGDSQRRQLAMKAQDPGLRARVLAKASSQGFLGDCYVKEANQELADSLLARITQVSTLERLANDLRKSNKRKSQAVAKRLADLKDAQGDTDPDHAEAERLVAAIERLARGQTGQDLGQGLAKLQAAWEKLRRPDATLQRRFDGAKGIVESALSRPAPALADPAMAQPADAAESDTAPAGPNPALEAAADAVQAAIRGQNTQTAPRELLAQWDRAWNGLKQPSEADEALKARLLPLLKELQLANERQSAPVAHKAGAKAAGEAAEQGLSAGLLDELSASLESGDLGKASELLLKARGLQSATRQSSLKARLDRLEGRYKELRAYQHWSHNQHREDLIARVEALLEADQHPDALRNAVQAAREEWQKLEKLEQRADGKRRHAAPTRLWKRFQAACQQAYEQAQPFLEKRKQWQQEHRQVLDTFLAESRQLLDDESTDTQRLIDTQRTARQAIRRLDELPPGERGQAAGALRDLMKSLGDTLDSRFEAIAQRKRALIRQAEALSQESDLAAAIEQAKSLQRQWKEIGAGKRRQDQALWQAFRKPIDPLFDQLGEQRQAQKAAHKAQIEALDALCQQAEGLAKLEGEALQAAPGRLQALLDAFADIPQRPPKLIRRMDNAKQALEQRLAADAAEQRAQGRQALARLCQAIQSMGKDADAPTAEQTASEQDATAEDSLLLQHARQRLAQVIEQATAGGSADAAGETRVDQARQLLVEMEFLSGLESPEADRQLRMEFQVARLALVVRAGQQTPEIDEELESLQHRWIDCLPLPDELYAGFEQRQRAALDILENMAGKA